MVDLTFPHLCLTWLNWYYLHLAGMFIHGTNENFYVYWCSIFNVWFELVTAKNGLEFFFTKFFKCFPLIWSILAVVQSLSGRKFLFKFCPPEHCSSLTVLWPHLQRCNMFCLRRSVQHITKQSHRIFGNTHCTLPLGDFMIFFLQFHDVAVIWFSCFFFLFI